MKEEEERLKKNKERRQQREKQKNGGRASTANTSFGGDAAMSPNAAEPSIEKGAGGTTRKCANCGQVGHIKTNKKCVGLLTPP